MTTFTYSVTVSQNGVDYSHGKFAVTDGVIKLDYGFSLVTAAELVLKTIESLSFIGADRSWIGTNLSNSKYVEIHRT